MGSGIMKPVVVRSAVLAGGMGPRASTACTTRVWGAPSLSLFHSISSFGPHTAVGCELVAVFAVVVSGKTVLKPLGSVAKWQEQPLGTDHWRRPAYLTTAGSDRSRTR